MPVFRRLGVRTAGEIDRERYALKALRGDFDRIAPSGAGDGASRDGARWMPCVHAHTDPQRHRL